MRSIFITMVMVLHSISGYAQSEYVKKYSDFPIIVTLQFQALALPFQDVKSNFSNIGIGLGTEVSLNDGNNLVQQVSFMWFDNRNAGNRLLFMAQPAWRPQIFRDWFLELKLGAGYLYAFRPVESYRLENDRWVSVGKKGKGMLAIPAGFSIGRLFTIKDTLVSPFMSYQMMALVGYNESIPAMPETIIQIGSRIHLNKHGN